MSGHLEQIRLDSYKPLRELVCEHIRDAIINGVFAPGERLMEIQNPQAGDGRLCGDDPPAGDLCVQYVDPGYQRRV